MLKHCQDQPSTITTDKHGPYIRTVREVKEEGVLKETLHHRQNQYLNNIVEQDHRRIKRMTRPMLGFQFFKTANRTLKGIEAMAMVIKEQTIYLQESFQTKSNFSTASLASTPELCPKYEIIRYSLKNLAFNQICNGTL